MDLFTLTVTIIGSASFGAIVGKFLDAFLLTRINDNFERKKLLRQNRIDAFALLSEELLALGLNKGLFSNPWKFKALGAKAILLIENKNLRLKIDTFVYDLTLIGHGLSKVETKLPDNFSIKLKDGSEAGIKEIQRGFEVNIMQKRAQEIVDELSEIIHSS